jgi:exodeoxyribonuclease-3
MIRIVTYNINGIRAGIKNGLLDWLAEVGPDILLLQETKAQPDQVPLFDFEILGYRSFWHSAIKKGYSGVAILTKSDPDRVVYGMGIPEYDAEGRFLRADYGDLTIASIYHPSGSSGDHRQDFKMKWLDDFYRFIRELKKERPNLILSGDYNICHKPIDIHDPAGNAKNSGFLPGEREWLTGFLESGFTDSFRYFNNEPHQYTWWSYIFNSRDKNLGWRIDYHMVSKHLEGRLAGCKIMKEARHSDHCPVELLLKD